MDTDLKILLVEDNPHHAELFFYELEKILDSPDAIDKVDTCAACQHALSKRSYDLVFLDLSLPDSHLTETLERALKSNKYGASIVALTSLDDTLFLEEMRKQGAFACLSKSDISEEGLRVLFTDFIDFRKRTSQSPEIASSESPLSDVPPQNFKTWERTISKVVHDYKAFIRNISGMAELMLDKYRGELPEDLKEYLESNRMHCEKMRTMTEDLRELMRLELDKVQLAPIDSVSCLREALSMLEGDLCKAEAEVLFVPSEFPKIHASAEHIMEIFYALIDNAIKFKGDLPLIVKVSAKTDGDFATFTIEDNGQGIPIADDSLDMIFAVFHQIGPFGSIPGTGMGLYRCRRILDAHGGSIRAEKSQPKGIKIVFRVNKA